jgi:hypothetical protein
MESRSRGVEKKASIRADSLRDPRPKTQNPRLSTLRPGTLFRRAPFERKATVADAANAIAGQASSRRTFRQTEMGRSAAIAVGGRAVRAPAEGLSQGNAASRADWLCRNSGRKSIHGSIVGEWVLGFGFWVLGSVRRWVCGSRVPDRDFVHSAPGFNLGPRIVGQRLRIINGSSGDGGQIAICPYTARLSSARLPAPLQCRG